MITTHLKMRKHWHWLHSLGTIKMHNPFSTQNEIPSSTQNSTIHFKIQTKKLICDLQ